MQLKLIVSFLLCAIVGFNPMWEESLVFTLHMTQIALVRFQVWDHDPIGQNFIGQRTIAFVSMMPGKVDGGINQVSTSSDRGHLDCPHNKCTIIMDCSMKIKCM